MNTSGDKRVSRKRLLIVLSIALVAIFSVLGVGCYLVYEHPARRVQKDIPVHESQRKGVVLLNLHINNDGITLLKLNRIDGAPPEYLPQAYDYIAKMISNEGELLGEFGFNDPRIVLAEPGSQGPTMLKEADFDLVLPYYDNAKKVDIYSGYKRLISIDI